MRTRETIKDDLAATVAAYNEAAHRQSGARTMRRKGIEAGSMGTYIAGCNRLAPIEDELAELLELCHAFGRELTALGPTPLEPGERDPFDGLT